MNPDLLWRLGVMNTGDPRRHPWKSSYSWSSPLLFGEMEPLAPENVDELGWDKTVNQQVERRGWRIWCVNDTEEKRVKRVDLVLEEHKEAEKPSCIRRRDCH